MTPQEQQRKEIIQDVIDRLTNFQQGEAYKRALKKLNKQFAIRKSYQNGTRTYYEKH